MEQSGLANDKINDEIFNKCIIGIIGFDNEQIDFEESPAGIVDHLSHKILVNSKKLIENIESIAKEANCKELFIPSSVYACEFYRKFGFDYLNGKKVQNEDKEYTLVKKYIQEAIFSIIKTPTTLFLRSKGITEKQAKLNTSQGA